MHAAAEALPDCATATSPPHPGHLLRCLLAVLGGMTALLGWAAQPPPVQPEPPAEPAAPAQAPIEVTPRAADAAIADRLSGILEATGWYGNPRVSVTEGIVILEGTVEEEQYRTWAGRIASNTEGVVAVINRIETVEPSIWDLSGAWMEIRRLLGSAIRHSPLVLLGLALLALSYGVSVLSARFAGALLGSRVRNALLRDMVANATAVVVFVLGFYFVLKVLGLTRLAVTVLGGTGLLGLVIGFGFRNIAENFLASLLLSIQRPFETGDLIEVAGIRGFVQNVNTRSTLLMTIEGNHVQIPNATIYKETITNFWSNPQMRCDFTLGIGYEDTIAEAQSTGLAVLREHPAVLSDPEPMVLVDELGAATVKMRFYFWINVREHSDFRVKSAVIRLTKRAFQAAGISMPDEQREVIFPQGVPVRILDRDEPSTDARSATSAAGRAESSEPSHDAEGGLVSDSADIEQQARQSRKPEGRNLLDSEN